MNALQKRDEAQNVTDITNITTSHSVNGYTEKLDQLKALFERDRMTRVFWRLQHNGYKPAQVSSREYIDRLTQLLTSDNEIARREAMEDIEYRLAH